MTGIDLLETIEGVDVASEVYASIDETVDQIADLNAAQMAAGLDSKGDRMNDYAPFTVRYKKEFGKGFGAFTDHRTLFFTGKHYQGLYVKRLPGDELEYGSTVSYADEIQEREGEDIYGLNVDSREEYEIVGGAVFRKRMEEATGLHVNE